jgi:hypothetical protein
MNRAAVAPQRTSHRTRAGAASSLLLPQFLARTGYFVPGLGLGVAAALAGQIMPDRFIKQRFIYFSAEYGIGKFQFADLRIVEIEYVYGGHNYLFALCTTT